MESGFGETTGGRSRGNVATMSRQRLALRAKVLIVFGLLRRLGPLPRTTAEQTITITKTRPRRPLACLIAAGIAVFAFSANAATVVYGEAFDTLYQIDLGAHTATAIGAAGMYGGVPIANISGLTTAADGTLYAVAGASKLFISVDPA